MSSEHKQADTDGARSDVKVMESSSPSRVVVMVRVYDLLLRMLGLVLTLTATLIVGLDKERKIISFEIAQSIPPLHIIVTAKWQYMSAFVYFLVSNAVACSYAAASLVLCALARSRLARLKVEYLLVLIILDLLIMGLLFTANGAAAAIGVIGRHGNSHVQWRKVCDVVDAYCRELTAAVAISLLGSAVFLCMIVLSVLNLNDNFSK